MVIYSGHLGYLLYISKNNLMSDLSFFPLMLDISAVYMYIDN